MATDETAAPVVPVCPDCGGTGTATVAEARGGKGALRQELNSRLQKGPEKSGDGCVHFLEGLVLTGMGVALAFMGVDQDKPLYLAGGIALALVCSLGTIVVVRGDGREKDAERAGTDRADRVWDPAHYCYDCASVFCPGGTPWQGVLTPEQFKKLVWTEAGYADQLSCAAKDADVPEGILGRA